MSQGVVDDAERQVDSTATALPSGAPGPARACSRRSTGNVGSAGRSKSLESLVLQPLLEGLAFGDVTVIDNDAARYWDLRSGSFDCLDVTPPSAWL